jgi:hypothetical protein
MLLARYMDMECCYGMLLARYMDMECCYGILLARYMDIAFRRTLIQVEILHIYQ